MRLREEERVLVALPGLRICTNHCHRVLHWHIYGNLLSQESLLSTQFTLLVIHEGVFLVTKGLTMSVFVTCSVKAVFLAHLVQLELVLNSLADHIFQLMHVT